ncbi:4Fe-4S ferredoxin-type, iron-sulphur binding domain protein [Acididesulfobacillus acetoxydans]|uniref:4Fe-4S ferredoxin-type, iron-sulphur binding domain protein n=1 Tax=Acididesulfobacillus acetoxydans TaxID=1561005 RepID=A0A8S0VXJ0_9FIRM|nr:4Fe-4S ferredoxin-type, iron-sulphur binding domain protein [Acididesulfobacillus acetoxydans]CEJ08203.1 Fe-S oxidoreductase [Acididesulfobacillus acetoxydans]
MARGRIRLVREHLDGSLDLSATMRNYLDLCLGCRACVVSCPPQVPTDRIVRAARAKYAVQQGQPLVRHVLLRNVLNKPERFSLALDSVKLVRTVRLNHLFPKTLKAKEDLLPELPEQTFWEMLKGRKLKKSAKKTGFFLSCMDNNVFPQVVMQAIKVLEKLDFEVVIPTGIVCCGAAHHNYGDLDNARRLARQNIRAFASADVKVILTDCASCESTMQSYGELFEGEKEEGEAQNFASRVMDINVFLQDKIVSGSQPVDAIATYHDPCHAVRYQNIKEEPRKVAAAGGEPPPLTLR